MEKPTKSSTEGSPSSQPSPSAQPPTAQPPSISFDELASYLKEHPDAKVQVGQPQMRPHEPGPAVKRWQAMRARPLPKP